jgi:hypothetical protein
MAEKRTWSFICRNGESSIFSAVQKSRPGYARWVLSLVLVAGSFTLLTAQTFTRQRLTFSLSDKNGTPLTGAAISSGKVKVFTLREAKTITHSHLSYDRKTKDFIFAESAISPGMSLAFVSAGDTMYVSLYGRFTERSIQGIKVQKGSYVLSSNEFGGKKQLEVDNWNKYLEDQTPAPQQDLSAYRAMIKDKRPVELVERQH